MNVLVVEPGFAPYEKEVNGLKEMQAIVGGLITAIYPFDDPVGVVCNDEALNLGMEFNRSMPGGYGGVFGPFFVCGLGKDDFCTLPPESMEKYRKFFHNAEVLIAVKDNNLITLKVHPRQPASHSQSQNPNRAGSEQQKHPAEPER